MWYGMAHVRFLSPATGLFMCAAASATDLGTAGDRFVVNGAPTFLLGISYYGALGAPARFVRRDLDEMQRFGFNWIRVWATWNAFGNDVSAVDAKGNLREPYAKRLQNLVEECDRRGMIVDVTLSRGNGINGDPRLPDFDAHLHAVRNLTTALAAWRNWYFDLANERNIRDSRFVSLEELKALRDAVKALDAQRLVTASHAGGDMDERAVRAYLMKAELDFLAPHRPRNPHSPARTEAWTRQCRDWCQKVGRVVPIHFQEPFRRGFHPRRWEPAASAFLMDLAGTLKGGAAGWCFHNGDQKDRPEHAPRRSFDMRQQSLFEQLDPVERIVVRRLGPVMYQQRGPHAGTVRLPAAGPLRISARNPRYFETPDGRIVYLTGSHTWATLVERRLPDRPLFDYDRWLDFLEQHHHNFFRMWAWEHTCWMQFAPRSVRILYHPNPWLRTGPGKALDGGPRFDLTRFDPAFFRRLRERVTKARRRGVYVAVMLFQGFSVEQKGTRGVDPHKGNPWDGHPFNRANNINGIDGDPDGDGEGREVHTLRIPAILELQKRYVRKMVETVGDLDNVLWEIGNECHEDSVEWQEFMIRYLRECEGRTGRMHPIGMTGAPIRNEALFRSAADWISPIGQGGYRDDPPAADGRKVIVSDTDHLWGLGGSVDWVWKSFLRGLNPIFMDPYRDVRSGRRFDVKRAHQYDPRWDPVRINLGWARRYAERLGLADAAPVVASSECSTRYCLRAPGRAWLAYQPDAGETVRILLPKGRYAVEWFSPETGAIVDGGVVEAAKKQAVSLRPPVRGRAVLFLQTLEEQQSSGRIGNPASRGRSGRAGAQKK